MRDASPPIIDRTKPAATRVDLLAIAGLFGLVTAAYWAGVVLLAGEPAFPLDDAYIHLQFARNLAETGQMAFNAGVPSSGCTAPLYAMLLALAYALVRDWTLASALLGGVASLGGVWLVYAIVRQWSQQRDAARCAALVAICATPTIIAAYSGMETPLYVLALLGGLTLYTRDRTRLLGSLCFAIGVWLRPEFMMLAGLIAIERTWAFMRHRRLGTLALEGAGHAAIWLAIVTAYAAWNYRLDGHLVPSTFTAKAASQLVFAPPWLAGLPRAIASGEPLAIVLALTAWPLLTSIGTQLGLGLICLPLALGSREAAFATLRDDSPAASGRRLAVLTLVLYPVIRGIVDPAWPFWFQFQRYYAHLTPLLIVIVFGALPTTGALVDWKRWSWRGVPLATQYRRVLAWALPFLAVRGAMAILATDNIHDMQIAIGRQVRDMTPAGALIAANDIGAIAFESRRPILDTIGLVEPAIIEHFRAGGSLTSYLAERKPALVIVFPRWYPDIDAQLALFKPIERVTLPLNVICGTPEMVIYRPHWAASERQATTAAVGEASAADHAP